MDATEVLAVLDCLQLAGVRAVLDGGWGVDALLGEQTRRHDDLDLVLASIDRASAERALAKHGLEPLHAARPGLPARRVLRRARDDCRVDFHLVVFDTAGNGWQELPDGGWCLYGRDHLAATGWVADTKVNCITAELQVHHHLGYRLTESDRHDLQLLAARLGIAVPPNLNETEDRAEQP